MEYTSLEQLVVSRYIETMPAFIPAAGMSVDSQRAMYKLITDLYKAVSTQPELMFASLHEPDIYHRRFNRSSEGKPELYGLMKRIYASVDALIGDMLAIGREAVCEADRLSVPRSLKIKKNHIRTLEAVGVKCVQTKNEYIIDPGEHAGAVEAWLHMARRDGVDIGRFGRCMFGSVHEYLLDIYRRSLGDAVAFDKLVEFLEGRGYERTDLREELALDYSKEYGKKPGPLKTAWAEHSHGGVSFAYYPYIDVPCVCSLRIPANKKLLEMAGDMSDELRKFVVETNANCSGCRYCVQTDKSGTRPLACVPVEHNGKRYALCPNFPGFHFTFEKLDVKLAENIIAYLKFIDENIGVI